MDEIIILGKVKFDLRHPDEVVLAKYELESILNNFVEPVRTIPALFKSYPFNKLTDEVIHIITRNVYLGEIQGYISRVMDLDIKKLIKRPAFFREIYLIIKGYEKVEKLKKQLELFSDNLYQIFDLLDEEMLFVRIFPIQTIFEFITDIKKLPDVAITPKNVRNYQEYLTQKEKGIEKGIEDLISHIKYNHYRAPHLGLGKKHIGDFIDWAGTDLRKPFLHYLHKYKGKGDPRVSRFLINLLKVNEGEVILDPFSGSGAFIADAPTMGINAKGIEILKFACLISNVKCNLNLDLNTLKQEILNLFLNIDNKGLFKPTLYSKKDKLLENLHCYCKGSHLRNVISHLEEIMIIKDAINQIEDESIRDFLVVLLSQKIIEYTEKNIKNSFKEAFKKYVEDRYLTLYGTLQLAKKLNVKLNEGEFKIINGDSTHIPFINDNSIDGILTSPPYFDALDYIESNKVPIVILEFWEDLKFSSIENYYLQFKNYHLELPQSSKELVELLKTSHRSLKAEIVECYLKMMKLSFKEFFRVLKVGRYCVVVVSKYHSWLINRKEKRVETSKIILDIALSENFEIVDVIQHGLSKVDEGKIRNEDILILKKPLKFSENNVSEVI